MPHPSRESAEPVRVVFRYDDCSARSSLDLERRFVRAFADCGAQVTLGVIPFVCERDFHDRRPQRTLPLSAEKVGVLRQAVADGHVEIALHGYSHQRWSAAQASELAGLTRTEQR